MHMRVYESVSVCIGHQNYIPVRRTVYVVQCTPYSVRRTVYAVQCTPYSVRRTVYAVQCTPYSVRRTVYAVPTICIYYGLPVTWYSVSFINGLWTSDYLINGSLLTGDVRPCFCNLSVIIFTLRA